MTPLVLLHGFTGSPAAFAAVRAALAPARRVLAPWISGHGGAAFPATVSTFAEEVARLASEIAAWSSEPVHLCGYSLGARIALSLAVHCPDRVSRTTLVSVNPGLATPVARANRRADDQRWIERMTTGGLAEFVAAWEAQPLFATQRSLPPDVLAAQRAARLAHDPIALARALTILGLGAMPDHLPLLSTGHTPLTVVVGEFDPAFRQHASRIAAVRSDVEVRVVPGVGHNVPLESPLVLARLLSEENEQ